MLQAAPSLQGTHTPELLQTDPTPQTVPAGCAPASTQFSTGRPPAELRQLMTPRRHGSEAMKHCAPMRQVISSVGAQVNCTSVEISVGASVPSGEGTSVACSSRKGK